MLSKVTLTTQLRGLALFQFLLNRRKLNKLRYLHALLALVLMLTAMPVLAGSVPVESIPSTVAGAVAHDSQLISPGAGYTFSFPPAFRAQLSAAQQTYSGYMSVRDESEAITLDVPSEWKDIDTGKWTYRGREVGVFIAASANLDAFRTTRSEPGVFIGVSRVLAQARDEDGVMTFERGSFAQRCQRQARTHYKDLFYGGQYELYANCAAGGRNRLVVVALPANREFLILLRITVRSEADLQAATKIFQTFQVLGDPEHDEHHDH